MNGLANDLRYAFRSLRKSPGFSAIALLALALGVGANVAIFSLIDEIWLRPMPVPHAERLIRIFTSNPGSEGVLARGYTSYPDFLSVRAATKALSGVASLERRGALLDTGRENKLVTAAVVSDNFFDVLRPTPALGRAFGEAEASASGARVVMLSYPFWRQQFDADSRLPGKIILLDKQQVLVAGILPRGFRGTEPFDVPDVWMPADTWVQLTGERSRLNRREFRDYEIFARRRPDATLAGINAELDAIAARLARDFPATNSGRRMSAIAERAARGAAAEHLSSVLLAIAALVLFIACANVASLLLARAEHRRHELATRSALGATRMRLVRQLFAETVLLTAIAAAAALGVGAFLISLLPALLRDLSFSAGLDAHMSGRGLLFAGIAAAVSLLVFGVFPAWQATNTEPVQAMKERSASGDAPRARVRSGLVVGQVALCMVLVVSGGLLVRSLVRAQNADPGFDAHQNMLVLELIPGFGAHGADADRLFVEEARRRIDALPGVVGTAAAMRIPFGLSGSGATRKVFLADAPESGDPEGVPIHYDPVSDRFFGLLGTTILRGRAIDARDVRDHARVVVVNQTMARRYWPGRNPIGQTLRLDRRDGQPYEVVGVSRDSVNAELTEDPAPYLYTPMSADDYGELTLIVKTSADASSTASAVRRTLHALNADVPIIYLASLREHMRLATAAQRLTTRLIASLAVLGLLLVAVGLYGLTSFLVGRRTREIGIRLALGAEPRSIFGLVLGRALLLTGLGVVAGVMGAIAATRALRTFLFGVAPGDVPAFITGALVLLLVTCAGAFLPSRRAARVDPMTALRQE